MVGEFSHLFISLLSGDVMSEKDAFVDDNVVLLSLHDVSPKYEDAVSQSYERLMDCGVSSFTLLTTPMLEFKRANEFERNDIFSNYLKSLDLEIALHGLSHLSKSGSIREFHGLPRDRILKRLRTAVVLIRRGIGITVKGFVPPSWSAPPSLLQAAKRLRFEYCVINNSIHSFMDNSQYIVSESFISQGTGAAFPPRFLMEAEFGGPIQIGIHPLDYSNTSLYDLLLDIMDRLDYKIFGYMDYLRKCIK